MDNFSKLSGAFLLAASMGMGSVQAATATSNMTVSAAVINKCTVTAGAMPFGNYDTFSATNLDVSANIDVACTKNTAPAITMNVGLNAASAVRRMKGARATPDFLNYEVYLPASNAANAACAYTTVWNATPAGTLTLTAAPNKVLRTYKACGRILAGQDVGVDSDSDTIVVTVTF